MATSRHKTRNTRRDKTKQANTNQTEANHNDESEETGLPGENTKNKKVRAHCYTRRKAKYYAPSPCGDCGGRRKVGHVQNCIPIGRQYGEKARLHGEDGSDIDGNDVDSGDRHRQGQGHVFDAVELGEHARDAQWNVQWKHLRCAVDT